MSNYYRITDPSDVRDLGDQMAAWELADNPKRHDWALQPTAPSADAVWTDGAWIVPPVATFTAEEIVSQYFSPYQIAALSRLEMALMQANKPLGPAMTAAKIWLESVMLGWAIDPTAKLASAYGEPGVTFEAASAEAVQSLQS
jgi:hypothetical protein